MTGLSHITLITADPDRMQAIVEQVLKGRLVYASGSDQFSLSEERFFMVGEVWLAIMRGDPLPSRSYNHIAFKITEAELPARQAAIEALDLDLRPTRPRVAGEGQSLYFHTPDNHLIELHTGTLADRLARYARGREDRG